MKVLHTRLSTQNMIVTLYIKSIRIVLKFMRLTSMTVWATKSLRS